MPPSQDFNDENKSVKQDGTRKELKDAEQKRLVQLYLQEEALSSTRSNNIRLSEFPENRHYVPTDQIKRRFELDDTEENKVASQAGKGLNAWNDAWVSLQDDGTANQADGDVNEGLGQTHRARLQDDDNVRNYNPEHQYRGGRAGRAECGGHGGGGRGGGSAGTNSARRTSREQSRSLTKPRVVRGQGEKGPRVQKLPRRPQQSRPVEPSQADLATRAQVAERIRQQDITYGVRLSSPQAFPLASPQDFMASARRQSREGSQPAALQAPTPDAFVLRKHQNANSSHPAAATLSSSARSLGRNQETAIVANQVGLSDGMSSSAPAADGLASNRPQSVLLMPEDTAETIAIIQEYERTAAIGASRAGADTYGAAANDAVIKANDGRHADELASTPPRGTPVQDLMDSEIDEEAQVQPVISFTHTRGVNGSAPATEVEAYMIELEQSGVLGTLEPDKLAEALKIVETLRKNDNIMQSATNPLDSANWETITSAVISASAELRAKLVPNESVDTETEAVTPASAKNPVEPLNQAQTEPNTTGQTSDSAVQHQQDHIIGEHLYRRQPPGVDVLVQPFRNLSLQDCPSQGNAAKPIKSAMKSTTTSPNETKVKKTVSIALPDDLYDISDDETPQSCPYHTRPTPAAPSPRQKLSVYLNLPTETDFGAAARLQYNGWRRLEPLAPNPVADFFSRPLNRRQQPAAPRRSMLNQSGFIGIAEREKEKKMEEEDKKNDEKKDKKNRFDDNPWYRRP